jgi:hypothetical protein
MGDRFGRLVDDLDPRVIAGNLDGSRGVMMVVYWVNASGEVVAATKEPGVTRARAALCRPDVGHGWEAAFYRGAVVGNLRNRLLSLDERQMVGRVPAARPSFRSARPDARPMRLLYPGLYLSKYRYGLFLSTLVFTGSVEYS